MFTRYTPEDAKPYALYAKDENGVDWYDFSRSLDKTTPKILVSSNGFVCTMGTDAESFPFPDGLTLFEVDSFPTKESLSWRYVDGKFIAYEDTKEGKDRAEKLSHTKVMVESKEIIDTLRVEKEYSTLSTAKADKLKQAARDYIAAKTALAALSVASK